MGQLIKSLIATTACDIIQDPQGFKPGSPLSLFLIFSRRSGKLKLFFAKYF
jgi:hypothetical protein